MQQVQTITWDENENANARAAEFLAAYIAVTEEKAFPKTSERMFRGMYYHRKKLWIIRFIIMTRRLVNSIL